MLMSVSLRSKWTASNDVMITRLTLIKCLFILGVTTADESKALKAIAIGGGGGGLVLILLVILVVIFVFRRK